MKKKLLCLAFIAILTIPSCQFFDLHDSSKSNSQPSLDDTSSYSSTDEKSDSSDEGSKFTVKWVNYDGTVIETDENVRYGTVPTFDSENPTREKDNQYTYIFDGWDKEVRIITEDTTYTAKYKQELNKYTITWKNYDGSILKSEELEYGTFPSYGQIRPERPSTEEYSYVFEEWLPTVSRVVGDATYVASYTKAKNAFTVTWKNYDGSTLAVERYEYGDTPTYNGALPVRANTPEYSYEFVGWTPEIQKVYSNSEYVACFKESKRNYTVTWENFDLSVLEVDQDVPYGTLPIYDGVTPSRDAPVGHYYSFTGWDKEIAPITGDTVFVATYTLNTFNYTITWENYDGTVLLTSEVAYGDMPVYTGETPSRAGDNQNVYSFVGWDSVMTTCTGNKTYRAQFTSETIKYSVVWKNYDGSILKTEEVIAGSLPSFAGEIPSRVSNDEFDYEFIGWSPEISAVTNNVEYIAQFKQITREYTLKWYNYDGSLLLEEKALYGSSIAFNGETPVKPNDENGSYLFTGWSPIPNTVTGNAEFTATFKLLPNEKYNVTWKNYDGTFLNSSEVTAGLMPSYSGNTPTKPSTNQYDFEFDGWSPELDFVSGDIEYTAQFKEILREYTIKWFNYDGTLLLEEKVQYGKQIVYNGMLPTKPASNDSYYSFAGWEPATTTVTGDATFTAQFNETNIERYSVTWKNYDGSILESSEYVAGEMPMYNGNTPTKASTNKYDYEFKGWSPEVSIVESNIEYTAQYNETIRKYEVRWVNHDSSLLYELVVEAGVAPVYEGPIPTKETDDLYYFEFKGWDKEIAEVYEDITYTALFNNIKRTYTITWKNYDGTVLKEELVYVTENPNYVGDVPFKPATEQYEYQFIGWSPALCSVYNDAEYIAQFEEIIRSYTIRWVNYDGTLLLEKTLAYGEEINYSGTLPTKPSTDDVFYTFVGWLPDNATVTGDATFTAQFSETNIEHHTVTWKNYDGTVLGSADFIYDDIPSYTGNTPTKPSTNLYDYSFDGWLLETISDEGDVVYVAQYSVILRECNIKWYNYDGLLLYVETINAGDVPTYRGIIPTKPENETYTYVFDRWDKEITVVYENTTYTALFSSVTKKYIVTWKNYNGEILEQYEVSAGDVPAFSGNTPVRPSSQQYNYQFSGWSLPLNPVYDNVEFVALFNESLREYTITWKNYDGSVLEEDVLAYGSMPSYDSSTPTKPSTEQYDYEFIDWGKELTMVVSDTVYTACFTENIRKFNVIFYNYDGSIIDTYINVPYGSTIQYYGQTPTRPSDDFEYTFIGWTPEFTSITADASYTACYSSERVRFKIYYDLDGGYIDWTEDYFLVTSLDPNEFCFNVYKDNYTFRGWTYQEELILDYKHNVVKEIPLQDGMVFKAIYDQLSYVTLFVNPEMADAAAYLTGAGRYQYSETVTFATEANEGYIFVGWYDVDGSFISSDKSISYGLYSTDICFEARFAKKAYDLRVISYQENLGHVDLVNYEMYTPSINYSSYTLNLEDGVKVTLTSHNLTDVPFVGWFDENGNLLSNDATFEFTMPQMDYKIYAKWDRFNISYALDNSVIQNPNNPNSFTSDQTITLEQASRVGYRFLYWSEEGQDVAITTIQGSELRHFVLVPHFELIQYTITYSISHNNYGNNPTSYTYEDGDIYLNDAPIVDGYEFYGWYQDSNFEQPMLYIPEDSIGDLIIYGKAIPIVYSINYVLNGGVDEGLNRTSYTVLDSFDLIPPPARNGYTFLGWELNGQIITSIVEGTYGYLNILASWELISYSISYELNGGTIETAGPSYYTVNNDFELPSPTRLGYVFNGWYLNESLEGDSVSNIVFAGTYFGDLVFYAKWSLDSFYVTYVDKTPIMVIFNMNYDNSIWQAQIVEESNPLFRPENPTRRGYVFSGWYTEAELQNLYDFTVAPTSDMVLYARWIQVENNSEIQVINPIDATSNSPIYLDVKSHNSNKPNNYYFTANKSESIMVYYQVDSSDSYNSYFKLVDITSGSTITSYLKFSTSLKTYSFSVTEGHAYCLSFYHESDKNYNIKVYFNYVTTPVSNTQISNRIIGSQYVTYTSEWSIESAISTFNSRTGYTFMGIYELPGGKGKQYIDKDGKNCNPFDKTSNVSLYAYYVPIKYEVQVTDDCELILSSQTYSYTDMVIIPTCFLYKNGYTFKCWNTNINRVDGENYYAGNILYGLSSSEAVITLYAVWEPITYNAHVYSDEYISVIYNLNDGTNNKEIIMLKNGMSLPSRTNPIREGFKFRGWFIDEECQQFYDCSSSIHESLVLYAGWEAYLFDNPNTIMHSNVDFITNNQNYAISLSNTTSSSKKFFYWTAYNSETITIKYKTSNSSSTYYYCYISVYDLTTGEVKLSSIRVTSTSLSSRSINVIAGHVYYLTAYRYNTSYSPTLTISFSNVSDYNYGGVVETSGLNLIDVIRVTYGESYSLDQLSRVGYEFLGYTNYNFSDLYTDNAGNSLNVWDFNTDMQFYAKWKANQYTFTFNTNGGVSIDNMILDYDTQIILPTPIYEEKSFIGWFTDELLTEQFDLTTVPAHDVTLYAKWIDYDVTLTHSSVSAISVFDEITPELFGASAIDTDGKPVLVTVTIIAGTKTAGDTITVRLVARGLYDIYATASISNIKVYGTPTLTYDTTKDYFNLSDVINDGLFSATAVDTFGVNLYVDLHIKEEAYTGGDLVTVVISTSDIAGNRVISEIEHIKVYGNPTILRNEEIDSIRCDDIISNELFGVHAQDSFGVSIEVETVLYSGSLVRGATIYVLSSATDSKGNSHSITFSINVYGTPTISDLTTNNFRVEDEITLDTLGIVARDSFDTILENVTLQLVSGTQIGGATLTYLVTATDHLGNVETREFNNIRIYGTPSLTFDTEKQSMKVTDAICVELFNAVAKDSFDGILGMNIEVYDGVFEGGNTCRFKISTTDHLGNYYEVITQSIKVYSSDDITLTYIVSANNIKLTSKGEEFNAQATNSFGETCVTSIEAAEGYSLAGGNTINLYIIATDALGNQTRSSLINSIKVYDTPTLTYVRDYNYIQNGDSPYSLFVVYDSFGKEVLFDVEVVSGSLTTNETITYRITATDKVKNQLIEEYTLFVLETNESNLELYRDGNFVGYQRVTKDSEFVLPYYDGYDVIWYLGNTAITNNRGISLSVWNEDSNGYVVTTSPTPITYFISYDYAGGNENTNNPSCYNIESDDITLYDLTRVGYTFAGWTGSGLSDPTKSPVITKGNYGDKSYTANWIANQYTVTFNPNLGVTDTDSIVVTYDATYALPMVYRVGYIFTGWYRGSTLINTETWNIASDVELTAKWDAKTDTPYVVNHMIQNINDDDYAVYSTMNYSGTSDSYVTPYVYTITGFTSPESQSIQILPDGSTVLNYYYTRNSYTITINGNGGNDNSVTLRYDAELDLSTYTRRPGHTFGCFYTDITLMDPFTNTKMPAYNVTLYAYWSDEELPRYFTYTISGSTVTITGYNGLKLNLVIPERIEGYPVTKIASNAFANATFITSLTVPNTVTSINESAFKGCDSLVEITLPFIGNSNLSVSDSPSSSGSSDTQLFGYIFGSILDEYNTNGTNLVYQGQSSYTSNGTKYRRYYIPSSLRSVTITNANAVSANAFYGCSQITSITLNDNVTAIYNRAFYNCSTLMNFTVPANTTTIGNYVFYGCSGLSNVYFNNSITTIGSYSFYNLSYITSITFPSTLTSIAEYAFYGVQLQTIVLPNSLSSIGAHAFENNTSIMSLTVPGSVTTIGSYAFSGCTNITELVLEYGISIIGACSFKNLSITTVVVPNSVTSINEGVFSGCNSLVSITLPFVGGNSTSTSDTPSSSSSSDTQLFGYIFGSVLDEYNTNSENLVYQGQSSYTSNGTKYRRYYIPSSLRSVTITNANAVSAYAFYGCDQLTNIILNESVSAIYNRAFYKCSGLLSFTIPSATASIGTYAFYGCTSISNLYLNDYLTTIDTYAFYNLSSVTTLSFPLTLTSIGDYAFYNVQLYSISFPSSLTSIGAHAFENNNNLVNLTIPGNVLNIGNYAFSGCTNISSLSLRDGISIIGACAFKNIPITSLTVPASVTAIGEGAFIGCNSLMSITLPFIGNSNLSISDKPTSSSSSDTQLFGYIFGSVLDEYNTNSENLVYQGQSSYTSNGTKYRRYYIPSSLRSVTITNANAVSAYAFYGCNQLTTISLNNTVTSIYDYAFYNCSELAGFTIPSNVTSIGNYAFYGCTSILNLVFNSSLQTISAYAFYNLTSVTSVSLPSTLTSIGNYAFYHVPLASLEIPTSVTSIGSYAFAGNTSISSLSIPGNVLTIGDYAFNGCTNISLLNLNNGIVTIGSYAFANNSITSLVVPTSVTGIGLGAFKGCNLLTTISLPFVGNSNLSISDKPSSSGSSDTQLFGYIFGSVLDEYNTNSENLVYQGQSSYVSDGTKYRRYYIPTSLTSVTITNAVAISAYAFYGCDSITSITINSGITTIYDYAFYNCAGLTSFIIPSSVTSVGNYAFYGCSLISSLTLSTNLQSVGTYSFAYLSNLRSVTLPSSLTSYPNYMFYQSRLRTLSIPSTVTSIGNYAFYANSLSSVTIPSSVTSVGNYAFSSNYLWHLTIENGLQTIGAYAFDYSEMKTVVIPNSVTSIGEGAIGRSLALESITLPFVGGTNQSVSVTPSSSGSLDNQLFGYIFGSTLQDTSTNGDDLVYQGQTASNSQYRVYKIPSSLKTVTITNATGISAYAFYGCSNLNTVTLNDEIVNIYDYAFYGCEHLYTISIPAATTNIGNYAFYNCIYTSTLTFNNALEKIGNYAFYGLIRDLTATFPSTLKTIGNYAFYHVNLSFNDLPSALTSIGDYAFCDNDKIVSITIPSQIKTINNGVFCNCSHITSVTIPSGVTSIGLQAFQNLAITDIVIPNTVTSISNGAFRGCNSLQSMTLPFVGGSNLSVSDAPNTSSSADTQLFGYIFGYTTETSTTNSSNLVYQGQTGYSSGGSSTKYMKYYIPSSLRTVTITNATGISAYAFYGCSYLTEVYLNSNVANIYNKAFSGCTSLMTLRVPSACTIASSALPSNVTVTRY